MLLRSSGRLWALVAGAVFVIAYVGALARALQTQSYNIWGSMLLVPALVAANIPPPRGRRPAARTTRGSLG